MDSAKSEMKKTYGNFLSPCSSTHFLCSNLLWSISREEKRGKYCRFISRVSFQPAHFCFPSRRRRFEAPIVKTIMIIIPISWHLPDGWEEEEGKINGAVVASLQYFIFLLPQFWFPTRIILSLNYCPLPVFERNQNSFLFLGKLWVFALFRATMFSLKKTINVNSHLFESNNKVSFKKIELLKCCFLVRFSV